GGDVDDGGGDGGGVEGVGLAGRDMPLPLGVWGAPAESVVVSVALASCRERRTCARSAVGFRRSPPCPPPDYRGFLLETYPASARTARSAPWRAGGGTRPSPRGARRARRPTTSPARPASTPPPRCRPPGWRSSRPPPGRSPGTCRRTPCRPGT